MLKQSLVGRELFHDCCLLLRTSRNVAVQMTSWTAAYGNDNLGMGYFGRKSKERAIDAIWRSHRNPGKHKPWLRGAHRRIYVMQRASCYWSNVFVGRVCRFGMECFLRAVLISGLRKLESSHVDALIRVRHEGFNPGIHLGSLRESATLNLLRSWLNQSAAVVVSSSATRWWEVEFAVNELAMTDSFARLQVAIAVPPWLLIIGAIAILLDNSNAFPISHNIVGSCLS